MGYEKFGALLRSCRERAGLTLDELAPVIGLKGKTLGSWERGRLKTAPSPEEVNKLLKAMQQREPELGADVLSFVIALGFEIDFAGLTEEGFVVGRAYQEAPDGDRRIVRLTLGVDPPQPRDEVGRSFRR